MSCIEFAALLDRFEESEVYTKFMQHLLSELIIILIKIGFWAPAKPLQVAKIYYPLATI